MDRSRVLHNLVTLIGEDGDSQGFDLAGAYAGVEPRTSRELAELWMETVRSNSWLIPGWVRGLDDDEFCAWFVSSLDSFALGYLLAGREALESPAALVPCLS